MRFLLLIPLLSLCLSGMAQIPLPKMIRIPGGSFAMGSPDGDDNETPVHRVTVSSFFLAETEVTYAQYDAFCDATGREKPEDDDQGRGNRPVIYVSWEDAQAYCRWVSEQTGANYRLPTEAEWEYAAGGGSAGRTGFAGTDSEDNLNQYAVYRDKGRSQIAPVKSKRANALGLYDMSGNVWEWCRDWYQKDYYAQSPDRDPQGPDSGSYRVFRGGSWFSNASLLRVAIRDFGTPAYENEVLGFRLARTP
jgi:formylglycine-generating enzyme required for sulfatase activity